MDWVSFFIFFASLLIGVILISALTVNKRKYDNLYNDYLTEKDNLQQKVESLLKLSTQYEILGYQLDKADQEKQEIYQKYDTTVAKLNDRIAFLQEDFAKQVGRMNLEFQEKEKALRADAVKKSKAVTRGHVAESFAPFADDFNYNPRDCRFMGDPIDYVIYSGMTDGECNKIVFVEVKSGKSHRTKRQNEIRKLIEEGEVYFETYRSGEADLINPLTAQVDTVKVVDCE